MLHAAIHDFALPIAINGRGRSHLRASAAAYGPAPSAIFFKLQPHIDLYFSFIFIHLHNSFSGLHVLGLERTLHDLPSQLSVTNHPSIVVIS
jgi:hypothetical protein